MAIGDNNILGLRTQILGKMHLILATTEGLRSYIAENWRFLHPTKPIPMLIVGCDDQTYGAFLVENRTHSREVFLRAYGYNSMERALYALLDQTVDEIGALMRPWRHHKLKDIEV